MDCSCVRVRARMCVHACVGGWVVVGGCEFACGLVWKCHCWAYIPLATTFHLIHTLRFMFFSAEQTKQYSIALMILFLPLIATPQRLIFLHFVQKMKLYKVRFYWIIFSVSGGRNKEEGNARIGDILSLILKKQLFPELRERTRKVLKHATTFFHAWNWGNWSFTPNLVHQWNRKRRLVFGEWKDHTLA